MRDLEADWPRYLAIDVTAAIIRFAGELAERHALRAYDALHLASAVDSGRHLGASVTFASWDAALENAATREGLERLRR